MISCVNSSMPVPNNSSRRIPCLIVAIVAMWSGIACAQIPFGWQVDSLQSNGLAGQLKGVGFFDADTGVAVGGFGDLLMVRTTTRGLHWDTVACPTTQPLNSMKVSASGIGLAIGSAGTILRSTTQGQTWTVVPSGVTVSLWRVAFLDDHLGVITGDSNVILSTRDGGLSWTRVPVTTELILNAVVYADASTILAMGFKMGGKGTSLLRTTNNGQSWSTTVIDTAGIGQQLLFKWPGKGFLTGIGNWILRTTDAGLTWTKVPAAYWLTYAAFADSLRGIVISSNTANVVHTTNGGETWLSMPVPYKAKSFGMAVAFPDSSDATIVGGNFVLSTANAGGCCVQQKATVESHAFSYGSLLPNHSVFDSVWVTNNDDRPLYLALNLNPKTIAPHSRGAVWFVYTPRRGGKYFDTLQFSGNADLSTDTIFASSYSVNAIFFAEPQLILFDPVGPGETTKNVLTVLNSGIDTMTVSDVQVSDTAFAVSPTSAIIGPGTSKLFTVSFHADLVKTYQATIRFLHNGTAASDSILVNAKVLAALKEPPMVASVVRLDPVYPNPLLWISTFSFSLPQADRVVLTVSSLDGSTVATLADAEFGAGRHAIDWPTGTLPNGVYVCRMRTSFGVIVSKLLVKMF